MLEHQGIRHDRIAQTEQHTIDHFRQVELNSILLQQRDIVPTSLVAKLLRSPQHGFRIVDAIYPSLGPDSSNQVAQISARAAGKAAQLPVHWRVLGKGNEAWPKTYCQPVGVRT